MPNVMCRHPFLEHKANADVLRPWYYSLVLDKDSPSSIHQQLIDHFRSMIEAGDWLGGSPLPSTRDIAQRLGINRKTVSRVYEELSAQGLIYTQPKRGTFVAETIKRSTTADKAMADSSPSSSAPHTESNSIESLIQKSSIHHLRRAALHLHKLRQADYDVTGLHHLKHLLANLLAHERRYLVPPEHIACGARQGLQQAILCNLDASQGYVLIDPSVGTRLEHALKKQGIPVMQLPEGACNQTQQFIDQVEKYCINFPVSAVWCDSSKVVSPAHLEAEQTLIAQKLSDYGLLLIDDQRSRLPLGLEHQPPLAAKYARSLLLGSLYGTFCEMFNICYVASNLGFTDKFLTEMDAHSQSPLLLNMLAQSDLIKRGEYKKLVTTIHRSMA